MKRAEIEVGKEYACQAPNKSYGKPARVKVLSAEKYQKVDSSEWAIGRCWDSRVGTKKCKHIQVNSICYTKGKGQLVHVIGWSDYRLDDQGRGQGKPEEDMVPLSHLQKSWVSYQADLVQSNMAAKANKEAQLKELNLLVDQCQQIFTMLAELDGFPRLRAKLEHLAQDPKLGMNCTNFELSHATDQRVSVTLTMDELGDLIARATNQAY